ncbi:MAG: glycosyltransferase family 2 protein [Planctomycetota bacterium]
MLLEKVSVIIPTYNGESEIRRAIDSALSQEGCDVEVIAVNDGSTDNTKAVLDSYGDRIRAIHRHNSGPAPTRNAGIAAATGDWIAFLDHDDFWKPGKLKAQLAAAAGTGADIIYTNCENFGDVNRVAQLRSIPGQMPEGDLFEPLLLDNFIVISSTMIRRSLLLQFGSFDAPPGVEDWDLWLRLAASGAKFTPVREAVTMYQWRPGSLSKNFAHMRQVRRQIIRKAMASERATSLPWAFRCRVLANVESCSAWFLASSSPAKAISWYARSLFYWPFDLNCWKGIIKGCLGRA